MSKSIFRTPPEKQAVSIMGPPETSMGPPEPRDIRINPSVTIERVKIKKKKRERELNYYEGDSESDSAVSNSSKKIKETNLSVDSMIIDIELEEAKDESYKKDVLGIGKRRQDCITSEYSGQDTGEETENILDFQSTIRELEIGFKKTRNALLFVKAYCLDKKNAVPADVKSYVIQGDLQMDALLSKLKNIELGVKVHVLKDRIVKQAGREGGTQTTPSLRRFRKKGVEEFDSDEEEIKKNRKKKSKKRIVPIRKSLEIEKLDSDEEEQLTKERYKNTIADGKTESENNEEWKTVEYKRKAENKKQIEQKMKEKAELKKKIEDQKKMEKRVRIQPPQKAEALIVKTREGKTFADLFNELKTKVGDENMQGIQKARRSRGGDLIIEMQKDVNSEGLEKAIIKNLGEEQIIRRRTPKVFYEIRDFDPSYDKSGLAKDLEKFLKLEDNSVEVKTIRYGYGGSKIAIISVAAKVLDIIGDEKNIRIGYTICKFKRTNNLLRCFKCHAFGHLSYTCKEEFNDKELCRRCGNFGHGISGCEAIRRCILCIKDGVPESKAEHIAGAANCPQLKKYMQLIAEGKSGPSS